MRSLLALFLASVAVPAIAAPDLAMVAQITDEAMNRGEAVETAAYLSDRIGPRLTNSPSMRTATSWTQDKFKAWGLTNVRTESFDFGRGWSIESASVTMVAPRRMELRTLPVAWTPATPAGGITAPVIVAPMRKPRDFAEWAGKLKGKIVAVSFPRSPADATKPAFARLDDKAIGELDEFQQPVTAPDDGDGWFKYLQWGKELDAFLAKEGAVGWVRMSYRDNGLLHGEGYQHRDTPKLPGLELTAEDYRRIARLASQGEVILAINSQVKFDDSDANGYNVLADIPGSDAKAGYVMAGAHLDSWVAADGATDNGAGSAVVMEAARILAALKVKPKRTIRFALWSGEEQGLWGSSNYIERHLVSRPANPDPVKARLSYDFRMNQYPIEKKTDYNLMAAYFNMDNGGGKLRGIHAEGNFAAVPTLREWLSPFASMGASTVVASPTGGTDHELMAAMGLPAFQFIQDPLEYGTTTHHSSVDTFDHLRPADLRQASVIMASLLWEAANADKPLPAKPLPTKPKMTDPFRYEDPDKKD
ncbi:M20/M25/M40 family metallo-hydrolase [Sandarakinorhabdus sp.]|uniref:M20/M25/M40 family metallo-hydrolase n=1 Tax=Sandarakinorhabdus sp. TaxID=1916663 RepID=UPI00286E474B|nr:M20/M25/M40 family metallo-hydrolase [Sandarakinorhabdus sp.]